MAENVGAQVRRPAEHTELMDKLLKQTKGGAFRTYRDVLVFAAAVGHRSGRRVDFTQSANPVEWSTLINRFGAEDLVNLIAFSETNDSEIFALNRLAERIKIFETYACGGLEVLAETIKKEALTPGEAVGRLVSRELEFNRDTSMTAGSPDLKELGRALGL